MVMTFALTQPLTEQGEDRRDVFQSLTGLFRWHNREIFQINRQVIRQFAAAEGDPGLLILLQQGHHRLAAIA
ncbi:Uncharacterised protein [Klebsiella pneumoniae]|nr:Uncharacterised protein [Klebsiella pneumoniae]